MQVENQTRWSLTVFLLFLGYRITQWLEQDVFEALEKGVMGTLAVLILTEYKAGDRSTESNLDDEMHLEQEATNFTTILETFEFRLGAIDKSKRHTPPTQPMSEQINSAFQTLIDHLNSTESGPSSHGDKKFHNTCRSISFVLGHDDKASIGLQNDFFVVAGDTDPLHAKATNGRASCDETKREESFISRVASDTQCIELWYSSDRKPDETFLSRVFANAVADLPLMQADEYLSIVSKNHASYSRPRNANLDKTLDKVSPKVATCRPVRTPKSAMKNRGGAKCPKRSTSSPRRPLPSPPEAASSFDQSNENPMLPRSFSPIPKRLLKFSPFSKTPTENGVKGLRAGRNGWKDISPGDVSEVPTVVVATPPPPFGAAPWTTANSSKMGGST